MKNGRKPLDDEEVRKFLAGELDSSQAIPEIISSGKDNSKSEQCEIPKQELTNLLARLTEPKESTIRLTVDLPRSMHQQLSEIAYKAGRKKVEIVRFLISEAFEKLK